MAKNFGLFKEFAMTGEQFGSSDAKDIGIVSRVFGSREEMNLAVMQTAEAIASKSPVAVIGIKRTVDLFKRDQIRKGLDSVKVWNMSQIFSEDVPNAALSLMGKTKPVFPKL